MSSVSHFAMQQRHVKARHQRNTAPETTKVTGLHRLDASATWVASFAVDLTGNGKPDIVAAEGGSLWWFEQVDEYEWNKHAITSSLSAIKGVIADDFDGDGNVEVLVLSNNNRVSIAKPDIPATPTGTWTTATLFTTGQGVQNMVTNDVDSDGRPECFYTYADNGSDGGVRGLDWDSGDVMSAASWSHYDIVDLQGAHDLCIVNNALYVSANDSVNTSAPGGLFRYRSDTNPLDPWLNDYALKNKSNWYTIVPAEIVSSDDLIAATDNNVAWFDGSDTHALYYVPVPAANFNVTNILRFARSVEDDFAVVYENLGVYNFTWHRGAYRMRKMANAGSGDVFASKAHYVDVTGDGNGEIVVCDPAGNALCWLSYLTPEATAPAATIGFGKDYDNGLSKTTVSVTNLNASGDGSLRWALEQTNPKLIQFDVGGVINLNEDNLSVDGQSDFDIDFGSAPSPVIIKRGKLTIDNSSHFAIRHARIRPGPNVSNPGSGDCLFIDNCDNFLVDHPSLEWSTDECFTVRASSRFTISNALIAEALFDANHPEGPHSKGFFFYESNSLFTLHNIVVANCFDRSPLIRGGTGSLYNVISFNSAAHMDLRAIEKLELNLVNIHTYEGADGQGNSGVELLSDDTYTDSALLYFSGCMGDTTGRRALAGSEAYVANSIAVNQAVGFPMADPPVSIDDPAGIIYALLDDVTGVGATLPERDYHDRRILSQVEDRVLNGNLNAGRIIDDPADVGEENW